MQFNMSSTNGGSLELKIVRADSNGKITYNKKRTVSYGLSASSFKSALYEFSSFYSYQHSVTMKMYDSNDNVTTNTSNATKYVYNVSLFKLRPESYQT